MRRFFIYLLILFSVAACHDGPQKNAIASGATPAPPSPVEWSSATYTGIRETPVTLSGGEWQGEPYVAGGASRPRVGLAESFGLYGDMDGDGEDEAVVLIWTSSGGSGTFDFLAVLDRNSGGEVVNTGTAALGDRVKIQSATIAEGMLVLDVLQAGPGDAMCCPRQQLRRTFALTPSGLEEISSEDLGRAPLRDPKHSE